MEFIKKQHYINENLQKVIKFFSTSKGMVPENIMQSKKTCREEAKRKSELDINDIEINQLQQEPAESK